MHPHNVNCFRLQNFVAIFAVAVTGLVGCTEGKNPNLLACPACGREIAKAALSCPNCGQPNPLKEKEKQDFEAIWSKDPIVGRDVIVASRCDIKDGEVEGLEFSGIDMPLENDGLRHISKLSHLRYLSIHSARVTDAGMAHLANLKGLVTLDLIGCSITSDGLAKFASFEELTSVSLDGTQASEAGLQQLKLLPKLERITLSGRQVSDTTLNLLAAFPNLKYLYLGNTAVTDRGLKKLKLARPNLTILDSHSLRQL